ncbi:MAG TPA: Na+/H+ antiporter [Polyangiaceae bacterium]|jgi:CPA1 family monovalent cation:H+ antiporter|nr:Na+/H+ antiporter [Polyangiaceae bacterium]
MHFEIVFVLLFAIATGVALAARWIKVPYTVALVVSGLVLGTAHAFDPPHLTKELLYAVFLPGLLFEASFHLEFRRFWQNKIAIHALAIPGVVAAIGITAAILTPVANALHFVEGFSFVHGLVFAALLAATDPIAVVALFKSLGAPKRLAVLVEGESLLNDGTAVVLYTLILGLVSGREMSVGAAVLDFVKVVGMGMLIGTAVGFAVSKVIQKVDDPMIEITLTTIAAYGSFVAAEHFHFSGVIATVVAGMLCGNYAARTGMSPSTRIAVESFWEYVAFALNSIVFLLIGFEVRIEALLASWKAILVAYLAVMLARAAVIYVVSALIARTNERIPWSWSAVLTWGGLRGGLSMVLVLALPAGFPHRELLVTMTFGVVVLSILTQGLSMGPLLRWFGLVGVRGERRDYEVHRGQARAARAVLAELDQMVKEGNVRGEIVAELRAEYGVQVSEAEERIRSLHLRAAELLEEERQAARRHALVVEKDAILEAYNKGLLGHEALEKLLGDVNARLFELEDDHEPPAPAPAQSETASPEKTSAAPPDREEPPKA